MALIYGAEWGVIGPYSRGLYQCLDCNRCAVVWIRVGLWDNPRRFCLDHMDDWIRDDCYARALSRC